MEIYTQAVDLTKVQVGDVVRRMLAGTVPMELEVTAITDSIIICGGDATAQTGWWFDKKTGAEIDDELNWGPPPLWTGSFISAIVSKAGVADR